MIGPDPEIFGRRRGEELTLEYGIVRKRLDDGFGD
jgi:hypothetical protein